MEQTVQPWARVICPCMDDSFGTKKGHHWAGNVALLFLSLETCF